MHPHHLIAARVNDLHGHRATGAGFEGEAGGAAELLEGSFLDVAFQSAGHFLQADLSGKKAWQMQKTLPS